MSRAPVTPAATTSSNCWPGDALGVRRRCSTATGGGHTARAFAGLGAAVVAYDLTEPMLQAARQFTTDRGVVGVRFVAGDVEALPFRSDVFSVVTCRIAAHHFANVAAAIRQIARVLAPGGSFLLQDILGHEEQEMAAFITEVERRRDPSHIRAYRAREWQAMLRGAGLTVIEEVILSKVRPWAEWTGRMRMTSQARHDLEQWIRRAPASYRNAFEFRLTADAIESFADRMILVRADKD